MQGVMVADSSGIARSTLWEDDIGLLKQGASYMLRYTLKDMQHSTGIPHERNGMEGQVSVSNAAFPWNSSRRGME